MSLLMQALKKAEHAKQNQRNPTEAEAAAAAAAEIIALDLHPASKQFALAPKEPLVTAAASNEHSVAGPSAGELDMLNMELTPFTSRSAAPAKDETVLPDQEFLSERSSEQPLASPSLGPSEQDLARVYAETKVPSSVADAHAESSPDTRPIVHAGMPQPLLVKSRLEQQNSETQAEKLTVVAQQKAKTVFASKQPPRRHRAVIIATIGLIAVAALAGFGYSYLHTISQSSTLFVKAQQPQSAALPILAVAALEAGATPAVNPALNAAANPPATAPATAFAGTVTTSARTEPEAVHVAPLNSQSAARPKPQPNPPMASRTPSPDMRSASSPAPQVDSVIAAEAKSIQIRQTSTGNRLNPSLANAYHLFMSGDAAAAQQQYEKVLQQESTNRDALLGMAAIAMNRKQAEQAGAFYVRLLELDPADPDAIAGLTSLQSGDASQIESRLKKILTQNPQAGAILFVLGNLYAQQSRWPEAQQTYFRAYGTAPGNADYAFNLAVSLDRLNQGKLALDFYQRALTLVQTSPGNFNTVAVHIRIKELKSAADG